MVRSVLDSIFYNPVMMESDKIKLPFSDLLLLVCKLQSNLYTQRFLGSTKYFRRDEVTRFVRSMEHFSLFEIVSAVIRENLRERVFSIRILRATSYYF